MLKPLIPYAMTCAVISAITYIIAGFVKNVWISLILGLVILIGTMFFLSKRSAGQAEKA